MAELNQNMNGTGWSDDNEDEEFHYADKIKNRNRVLPDWIDAYMTYVDESEPPDTFKRWVAISLISACLQRKCWLPWGEITFYPNLYIVLCSPPGKARKGTAMDVGLKLLQESAIKIKLAAEAITREALIRELRNSRVTYVFSNDIRMVHSSLTIYSNELVVFLGNQNKNLLNDLTDWYDCRDKWVYRTKGQGTDDINGVFVNILGAATPSMIQSALPPEAIGGGLTSRIVFIFEFERGKDVALPRETEEMKRLRPLLISDLEVIKNMGGHFIVTEDFEEIYKDWYLEERHKVHRTLLDDEKFAGYIERRPATLLKMSMVMSASRSSEMLISGEDFIRGLTYLEQVEQKMAYALGGVGRRDITPYMSQILYYIRRIGETNFTDLLRRFMTDVSRAELEDILASYQKTGALIWISNTGRVTYNKAYENGYLESDQ